MTSCLLLQAVMKPILSENTISATVVILIIWAILLIPFRVIGYGYLPADDAMRHSAKAVSGKDWSRILILNDKIKMDSYLGWHTTLEFVHRMTGGGAHSLALFSVIFLFILFSVTPVFFLRYPEAWIISLAALTLVTPVMPFRLLLGRPYIVTMWSLVVILFLWPRLKNNARPYKEIIFITFVIAASVWIHCGWYLFLLPIACFLLAREWRAAAYLAVCWIAGTFIGAASTGQPVLFIKQTILHLTLVLGNHDAERMLVSELRPSMIDGGVLFMVLAMLGWRAIRGRWKRGVVDNPVFILAALSFFAVFISRRIWVDWGLPAVAVWMAGEFDEFLLAAVKRDSWRRVAFAASAIAVLYIALTADVGSRWSLSRPQDYLSSEDPRQAGWLPEPGGIIYSDDMTVFYQTFFKNPRADWRYVLGFESGLMSKEDLAVYRDIQRNFREYKWFEPWVKKMKPEDRLVMRGGPENKPKIPELEWDYTAFNTWVGRLPRKK